MSIVPVLLFDDDSNFPLIKHGKYIIGSLDDCDIQLSGDDIDDYHAALISSGVKVLLQPTSNRQVIVNGLLISGLTVLADDDEICIGDYVIKIKFLLKTALPPTPIFGHLDKNPFLFDDEVLLGHNELSTTDITVSQQTIDEDVDQIGQEETLQPISTGINDETVLEQDINFSAYYPRTFSPSQRGSVIVYMYLADALVAITRDVQKFAEELGGEIPRPRKANQSVRIKPDTLVTISIESDSLLFEPESITRRWVDEWARFIFEFKIPPELEDEQVIFHVVITIAGIEVARIANCVIEIVPSDDLLALTNPLATAVLDYEETQLYQHIFVSYSRNDTEVVEAYKLAQEALGNEVFMDTYSIRSGQDWQVALENAIQKADIFQLFWSDQSANSDNVQAEWQYALANCCENDRCRGFIRPVYWQKPMLTQPPDELQHLNFRYVPFQKDV
jgi:hypothetical protein